MNIEQKYFDRFWSKVCKKDGCWSFDSAKDRDGYHIFSYKLAESPKWIQIKAHRFMILATGGSLPKGKIVCHYCDNPSCVNPSHLRVDSPLWNNLDKIAKGRDNSAKGQRQAKASISDETARLIKAEARVGWRSGYNNGSNISEVAEKYGVKRELVRRIARGELYKHI